MACFSFAGNSKGNEVTGFMLRFLQFTFQELQRLKNRNDFGVKKRLQQANFMRLSAKGGS